MDTPFVEAITTFFLRILFSFFFPVRPTLPQAIFFPNPVLPFLVFFEFLVFWPCKEFLVFLSVFPFFSRDFRGSAGIKKSLFFGWFSLPFSKKTRKGRTGKIPFFCDLRSTLSRREKATCRGWILGTVLDEVAPQEKRKILFFWCAKKGESMKTLTSVNWKDL